MNHGLSAVRAICFDLDNTLWDVWPVIVRAEQAMYDFLALRYPRVTAAMTVEMIAQGARGDCAGLPADGARLHFFAQTDPARPRP